MKLVIQWKHDYNYCSIGFSPTIFKTIIVYSQLHMNSMRCFETLCSEQMLAIHFGNGVLNFSGSTSMDGMALWHRHIPCHMHSIHSIFQNLQNQTTYVSISITINVSMSLSISILLMIWTKWMLIISGNYMLTLWRTKRSFICGTSATTCHWWLVVDYYCHCHCDKNHKNQQM